MAKKKKIWKPYISEPKPLTKIEQMMFNTDPVLSRINNTERRTERRIDKYFDQDTRRLILDCINGKYDDDDSSNVNVVAEILCDRLRPMGFQELGTGSNRICFLKDGYAFKIAMDRRGCIDNMSEYLRSIEEPDLLAKTYETNRMIAVSEYAKLISRDEFEARKDEIREMLEYLSRRYVIQDLGLTPKNFCNVGLRDNGNLIFIDYAYMYKIAGNEEALVCQLCGGQIRPNDNFTAYQCSNPSCRQPYLAYEILNRMDRDVDDIDDEHVVKLISTDDQGTDTTNFTFVKVTGDDVGEIQHITEEEATEIKSKIEKTAEEEQMYLRHITDIENIDTAALTVETDEEETPDVPEIRYRNEGVAALSSDEFDKLLNMAKLKKAMAADEDEPLYSKMFGDNDDDDDD